MGSGCTGYLRQNFVLSTPVLTDFIATDLHALQLCPC